MADAVDDSTVNIVMVIIIIIIYLQTRAACGCSAARLQVRVCGLSLRSIGCTPALSVTIKRRCSCSAHLLAVYVNVLYFFPGNLSDDCCLVSSPNKTALG